MKRKLRIGVPIITIGAALISAVVLLALRPWADDAAQEAAASPAEYGICNVSFTGIPDDVIVGPVPKINEETGNADLYIMAWIPVPDEELRTPGPAGQPPGVSRNQSSRIVWDAVTGDKVFEAFRTSAEEAKLKNVVSSVGPWEPIGPAWPRTDTQPSTDIVELVRPVEEPPGFTKARLKYRLPEEGAGIIIGSRTLSPEILGPLVLRAYTCESIVELRGATGEILEWDVIPEEEAMFQRFLEEVVAP